MLKRPAAELPHEALEPRRLLSGSNAVDRINFGNAASESSHGFDIGVANTPQSGTGALGQTYRVIAGPASGISTGDNNEKLTFTMNVDSFKQNYLTIKLWGSDTTPGIIYLVDPAKGYDVKNYDTSAVTWLDWQSNGAQPVSPGRFFYETTPIPLSWTQGKTSVTVTLDAAGDYLRYSGQTTVQLTSGQATRPIYTAFTTTDPAFIPDSTDATGAAPISTSPSLGTLSTAQAQSILLAERKSIYGTNGYFSKVIARQILPTTAGAPPEVIGLDAFTSLSSLASSAASTWDAQIGNAKQGPGYTGLPDELLSLLSTSYLLKPLAYDTSDPSYYHDSSVLQRIVYALDGSTYAQGSDGGFAANGSGWVGLTAGGGPRSAVGSGGFLEGIDVQALGYTMLSLLNDPAAPTGTKFATYLSQSFDANLNGGSMPRAYAYERMLFNNIQYLRNYPGGASSQNMFQVLGAYADQVALEKLQQLFPNPAYGALPTSLGLEWAQEVLGLAPTTFRGGYNTHFALTPSGLGKDANLDLEGGYDRGYGQWFPQLALDLAKLAQMDPGISSTADQQAVARIVAQAKKTVTTYDQFLSSRLMATTSGGTTTYANVIGPDDVISTRNPDNPGNVGLDLNTQFQASNPASALYSPLAARSAYLQVQYGKTPELFFDNQTQNSNLQYLRELGDYEATINSLVGNTPSTPLPGEAAAGNYAWADVQGGAVSIANNGQRMLMNLNYRAGMEDVDNLVRIHDTTSTIERIATVYMPSSGATVQSDGNKSGNFAGVWVVRYGNYLVVLNRGSSTYTATLPKASGTATDMITGLAYAMGGTVPVAAGQAAVIYLGKTTVSQAAAAQPAAPASTAAAARVVAGPSSATVANGQALNFAAAVLDATGIPLAAIPTIAWTLKSGVGSIDQTGFYTAPVSGTGTATIVATANGVTSDPITINILPFTAAGQDIGTVGVAGSDSYAGGTYSLSGAGAGLAGNVDAFHFMGTPLTGNQTLVAQVNSATATAGVTIRGSTAANAAFAAVTYTPGTGLQLVSRTTAGGTVTSTAATAAASGVFVRLVRSGSGADGTTYTASYSNNAGASWTTLGATTIVVTAIPAQASVGLLATSHSKSSNATATFSNVTVTRPAAENPSITSLSSEVHGVNSFYRMRLTTAANSGAATLTTTARVVQASANVGPYHFQNGVDFYPTTAGTYVIAVTVMNSDGLSTTKTITITDNQIATAATIMPASPIVQPGTAQLLSLAGTDEYGHPMTVSGTPTWTLLSGGGSVSSAGVFAAPASGSLSQIQAVVSGVTTTMWIQTHAAPIVTAMTVNNGSKQRSMVNSLTATFDQPVTLTDSAIALTKRPTTGGVSEAVPFTLTPSADKTQYVLTFVGSLANGIYDLVVTAGSAGNSSGQFLTTARTLTFHRLFGDSNGDATVDSIDSLAFRRSLGTSAGSAAYLSYFDFDGNGKIDSIDSLQQRRDLGITYTY